MELQPSVMENLPPEALRALDVMVKQLISDRAYTFPSRSNPNPPNNYDPFPNHNYNTGGRATNNRPYGNDENLMRMARQAMVTNKPVGGIGYFNDPFDRSREGKDTFSANNFYNQDDMLAGLDDDARLGAKTINDDPKALYKTMDSNLLKLLEAAKLAKASRFTNGLLD